MLALGSLAFASPWLLAALGALPVIWWLLRVTPPAPRRLPFAAIRLLLGLVPREETPARTPLWLILLRMTIAALVIVALAHPVLHPQTGLGGTGPLVLVVDDGWAAAPDWAARVTMLGGLLDQAGREGRPVILATTAPLPGGVAPPPLAPLRAADASAAIAALAPEPWPDDRAATLARLKRLPLGNGVATVWVSDGVADPGAAPLARYLADHGSLRYVTSAPQDAPLLLAAGDVTGKDLGVVLRALPAPLPRLVELRASGVDGSLLTRLAATLPAGATSLDVSLPMPTELRNRVARIAVEGAPSAGAVVLADERWRRRPVGIAASPDAEGQPLLSETYYVERALAPYAELRRGRTAALLKRGLAVLVFADRAPDSSADAKAVADWVDKGGLLLRFAGPHLAAPDPDAPGAGAPDLDAPNAPGPGARADTLLPVRLRQGGRTIGGALSWERPAHLAPFGATSPFAGLEIPADVTVSRQVLAEPDIDLARRTWARLADGTPLVTAAKRGRGLIVLVHTTANAAWSNLALSGLFVEMLRRIVAMSAGIAETGTGTLPPLDALDGFGRLDRAPATARPVAAAAVATTPASPLHPPGFYGTLDARRALNLATGIGALEPIADLPAGTVRASFTKSPETDARPPLLTAALLLLLVDLLVAYGLRGLLRRRPASAAALALVAWGALALPGTARAEPGDAAAIAATQQLHLAYVVTGDAAIDSKSRAGLVGLSDMLSARTAVEPAAPTAIDLATSDLVFYPLLYWPVTASEAPPSPAAVARINRYMETGGTILFDTQDADRALGDPLAGPPASEAALRRLTAGIRMPTLVPLPPNHVLTKSFYLMHEFPGRWAGGQLWIEPTDAHVNDGVASVIVGGNDWAGAWAVDSDGNPLYAVVPGGERQREMAFRFGINLVMYVLTGNYKSDQVHVPAILERLGQ